MPSTPRKVRVDREGNFELGGRRYYIARSQLIINEGQWECWSGEPDPEDLNLEKLTELERHRRNRPLWVEPTYREARDHIDRAADVGHF